MRLHANELSLRKVFDIHAKRIKQTEKLLLGIPNSITISKFHDFRWRSFVNGQKVIDCGQNDLINQLIHHSRISESRAVSKDNSIEDIDYPSSLSEKKPSNSKDKRREKFYLTHRFLDKSSLNASLKHLVVQSDVSARYIDPKSKINNATRYEEIFGILSSLGHHKISNRLTHLYKTADDDEPDDPDMEFRSLQKLAIFFIDENILLPDPKIGISDNGFLQAEWYSSDAAALLNFMPDGNIIFAATSTIDDLDRAQDVHGTGGKELALQSIFPFLNQL